LAKDLARAVKQKPQPVAAECLHWRRSRQLRASGNDSSKPQTHSKKQKQRRNRRTIGFMPLEPRVMYDGAAAASAAVAHHHADPHHDIANGSGMPGGGSPGGGAPGAGGAPGGAPSANGAPASGAGEWQYHGSSNGHWSGEQGSVGSIAGDKSPGSGPAPTVPSLVSDPSSPGNNMAPTVHSLADDPSAPGNSMAPTVGSLTGDHTPITQVVFIDSQTPDATDLINGVKPGTAVFEIDSGSDGLAQIANILAQNHFTNLTAIDIVGHGEQGEFTIGSTNLTDGNISSEAQNLAAIGQALAPNGDLMLYGCEVAAGAAGQQFINDLSVATGGAHVAASTENVGTLLTNNSTFENWTLDASTGTIDATTPFTQAAMDSYQGLLSGTTITATGFTTTLTVDSDGDGGISPGDTVTSQVTINNTTATAATGVAFSETLSGLTELTGVTITPIGVNDSYTLVGNTPETFDAAHGVLSNDIDFNGDTLTVGAVNGSAAGVGIATAIANGTLTLNSDGSFTFTPTTGFSGTTSFNYTTHDGAGNADQTATVTLTVTAPVWYVDSAASTNGADGSYAHPFTTVNSAVNAAAADISSGVNNTIFVENAGSTYSLSGHIQLAQGEELLGDGSGVTSINGNSVGLSGTNTSISVSTTDYVVQLNSGNTISGINITNTGTGAGIIDDGGTIGTLTMSNIAVNTASGTGISLTHGGTVDITGTSNTIHTTAGTALDITGTTIGAEGATFKSISAGGNGSAAGIILDNTGTTAGLTVTGDGSTTAGGDGSGGTISNETGGQILTGSDAGGQSTSGTDGVGIFLENTFDPSFTNMSLSSFSNFGIYGLNVTGFTLFNSTVSGTNGQTNTGDRETGSIRFDNLLGIAAITGSTISGGYDEDFMLQNTSGTLTQLTINNDTFGLQPETTGNNIWVTLYNGAIASTTITNNTFLGGRDDFITEAGNNTSTLNAIVETNHFEFGETPDSGDETITISGYDGTFNIVNNTIDNNSGVDGWQAAAIFVEGGNTSNSGASFSGTIDDNHIGSIGNLAGNPTLPGTGDPIAIRADGSGTLTALIENNTIGAFGGNGIYIEGEQGTNTINATVFGNDETGADSQNGVVGFQVTAGALSSDDSVVNLAVGSATTSSEKNTFVDNGNAGWDIGLSTDGTNSKINLSLDGAPNGTAFKTVITDDNTVTNNGGVLFNTSGGPTPPVVNVVGTTPTQPPAEPTFLTSGFSISGTDTEGDTLSAAQVASEYQWQESFSGSEYVDISGATSSTYVLQESDVGATLRLIETSANNTVVSAATSSVADNLTLTGATISGSQTVGQVLTASGASADNSDATLSYQWKENFGSGFVNISGADGTSYRLASGDAGATVEVVVTAIDPHGGSVSQTTIDVGAVAAFTSPNLSNVSIGTLAGNDSVTLSWEATVNSQHNQIIVNPSYTGSVTGSNFTTVAANSTVTLDALNLEGEIFVDQNADGLLEAGDNGINNDTVSVFVQGGSTALETVHTNASGIYDFNNLAAGNYFVSVSVDTGNFGNSSPVRDTTPNDYLGGRNYGGAISSSTVSTNAITIAYDKPEPTSNGASYPGDDTTSTLDIGLTKNPTFAGGSNTVDFYQGNGSVAVDSGLIVNDTGINVTSATVSIGSFLSGDTLNFTTQNGISGNYNASTGVLSLTGSATAAQYQTALESITYSFSGDPTNAGADKTRTVTWSVSDADGQTSVITASSTIDTFVTPVLAAGTGFTTPVMTTAGALAADADVTVADVNTTGTAPVATVTISNGFDTGDTLSYNGGTAHTFTDGGQITGVFNSGTHALTLTGTTGTSAADFQTALEAVQFNTTNSNANDGTRTLTWVFNDKAGNNTNNSNSLTTHINVEFPPTIGNTGNSVEFYQGQASGTVLDSTITDTDPNVLIDSATVTISPASFQSGDQLLVLDTSTGLASTSGVYTGLNISYSYNSATGVLTLSGADTAVDYQHVLRNIEYSSSGDPTNAGADTTRTVTWSVTDANGQSNTGSPSSAVQVFALPIVNAGAAGTPTENSSSGPVVADSTLTITDYNGTTIHNASVQITSGDVSTDTLTINGLQNGSIGTITFAFSGSTLTLTGTDTVADYQAALELVKFNAVSPNSGTRTLTWEVNDQAGGNTNNSTPITTNVNVAFGASVTAGGSATYDGGTASSGPLDSTLTVSDPTSPNSVTGATVSITTGFDSSGDTLNFTTQNGISGVYDSSTGVLTLSGTATAAEYQTALESVTYSFNPANDDPTNGGGDTSRTISWTASDATTTSPAATSTLTVVHEPPTVTAGGTVTFTGGSTTPVMLDSTAVVSAVDSAGNINGATISISGFVNGDTLNFTNQNGITGTYNSATGVLTLAGTASDTNYTTALDSITYSFSPTNGDPTSGGGSTSRTINWSVNDGSSSNGTSTTATSTLDTVHVAPTVTAGATVTFNGGGSPVTLDLGAAVTVTDPDSAGNLTGATVQIGTGFTAGDTLDFTSHIGITGSYDSATGALTFSGTASVATYQALLESITYSFNPVNGDPTAGGGDTSRTVSFTVTDGSSSNGTSNTATSTVDVVHTAPTVTAGATAFFLGGNGPVTLDPTLTVSDPDSGSNLDGATVQIGTGFINGDTLNFTNQNGITGSYDSTTGVLTLSGTSSMAHYQGALDSITYSFTPTNGDPTSGGGDTTRSISWTVTDGSTSNGTSNTGTSTLNVTHTAPMVTAGGTVTFDGGSNTPVTLDGTLTVSDHDSGGNLTGATVSLGANFTNGDTLNFTNQNGITGVYDSATGVLTLSGPSSTTNYQTALESITYSFSPSNGDPTAGGGDTSRTVSWTVTDGSTQNGTSNTGTSTLDVVHTAPTLTAGGTVTFDGGSATPVTLDGTLTVSDSDSGGNLTGATVSVTGFVNGDQLNFTGQNGISGTYDSGTGILTLTGTASVTDYQTALDSITYSFSPTNGDPTSGGGSTSRTINWTVTDGSTSFGTSSPETSTLDVVHTAPTVTAGAAVSYELSGPAVTADGTLTTTDADSAGNLTGATVQIGTNFATGDTLNFVNQNGIDGTYDSATGVLTLSGTASVSNYETALDSITFSTTSSTTGTRTLDWSVTDGSSTNGTSNTDTSTVDVVKGPAITAGATVTFDGGSTTPVTLDSTLTVTDVIHTNLNSAQVSIGGFVNGDTLNFTNQNGIFGSYDSVTGVLTLTGASSVANYQTALESITYSFSPTNGDPTNGGGDTSRTISWSANDGTATSDAVTSTVNVVHVAPTVAAGSFVEFTGGSNTPVTLDGSLTVNDVDSNGNLTEAQVTIAGGLNSGDTLNFINQNGISGTYDSVHGVLTLTGTASITDYEVALESVTYSFSPTNGDPSSNGFDFRIISWAVSDGSTSNGTGGDTSLLEVNHVPPTVTAGAIQIFDGGSSTPVTLDSTLTVSDQDSNGNLSSATVEVSSGFTAGDTLNFTNQNGISGSYDSVHGVLTLTGTASVADYQTALESVTYSFSPTNGDPTAGGSDTIRSISFVVNDGNGISGIGSASSTLDVVHTAPVVTAGGTVTFNGGDAATGPLDGTLTVSDVDNSGELTGATVQIGTGFLNGDTLNFTNQNGITGSYDSTTGILTLGGTASVTDYRTALESITYSFSPSNGDPTNGNTDNSRTIDWTVTDGNTSNGTSNTDTSTITVNHTPPSMVAGASVSFTGGSTTPVTLDSTLTVNDVDSNGNLSSAFVSIFSGFTSGDTLNFTNQNGITGSYDAVHGVLTLTGTASVADYQTALESVTYSFTPTNGDPTAGGGDTSRVFTWTADDGESSTTVESSLTAVHVAPTVTAGATVTFDGGSPTPVTLDSTATVGDVDSSGNLTGATVSISSGFSSGDLLHFTNQNGITGVYDSATGVLTLSGTSSTTNYQAALDSISYSFSPTNGDPTAGGGDTSRSISWSVTDGSTSNGTSNTDTSTINVVHEPPVLTAGATATFEISGPAVTADSTLTVTAPDSNGNLHGAVVSISTGFTNGDTLNFTNQNGITGVYNPAAGSLQLMGTASATDYQTALDSITFSSSTGSTGTRTLQWSVSDTDGYLGNSTSTIDIVKGPILTAGGSATFNGGSAASGPLDSTLTVSDPAQTDLTGATVSISSNFLSGDELNFTNQNGITGSYDAVHGVLTLSGSATVAEYQTALDSVTYSFSPSSTDPTNGGGDTSRTITWTASDVTTASPAVTSSLTVNHTAPVVAAEATATFNGGGPAVTLDSALTVSDVDTDAATSGDLTGASVSISTGFTNGDLLNFTNQNGISGTYDAVHGVLTLTGTSSVSNYQAALDSITYSFNPSNGDPTAGGGDITRVVTWTVNDGNTSNGTASDTSKVIVNHEAPVVTAGGTATFDGGGSPATLDNTLTVTDADSNGDLTGATVQIGTGFTNGDVLNFTNQNGISGTYDSAHGILTLTGPSSVSNYQAALESITYSFTAGSDPTTGGGDTSRTISWTVTDGNTSNGASNTSTSALDVVHVAPKLTSGGSPTFDGGGPAVTLHGVSSVTDVDSGSDLVGATVSISSGLINGDLLNFTNQNGITGSYDAVHGVLTLTGTANIADYFNALNSITYSFSPANGDPTNGGGDISRTISWQVTDGNTGNGASNTVTTTVNVVHEAPVVTAGATVTLDQNSTSTQAAVTLDAGLTLTNVDSNSILTGATVTISSGDLNNSLNTDVLTFTGQSGISGTFNAATGTLALSGTASFNAYEAVLQSVEFNSNGPNPTSDGADATRTITWTITDGNQNNSTATATSTVDVKAFPTVVAGADVTYQAGLFGQPVKVDASVGVYDDTNITSATVSLGSGFQIGDILLASTSGTNVHALYNPLTGVMTLSGTDTPQHYDQVMQSITFASAQLNNGPVTVDWHVTDVNNKTSTTKTSEIQVKGALFPVLGNLTNNSILPPTSPHSGSDNFSPTFINFANNNGGASFGDGQSVIPLHADVTINVASDGAVDFNAPLGVLEASLDGDVVFITATLPDGKPLPDWLHFDTQTGKFAGIVPGDVLTGSLPQNGGDTGGNQGGLIPDKLTVEVVATDAKGDIAIIDFTINLKPDNNHHGWNLPRDLRNLAPIELPHQHAQFLPQHGLPGPLLAAAHGHDNGHDHGAGHVLAGRAGLSQQLAGHGLHGMHADRMALLESLRHATAGHG
jgi:hypothetical protein